MLNQVLEHLESSPFTPFRIRMADGREYLVPTLDHIWIPFGGGQIRVEDDDGRSVILPTFHISGLLRPPTS